MVVTVCVSVTVNAFWFCCAVSIVTGTTARVTESDGCSGPAVTRGFTTVVLLGATEFVVTTAGGGEAVLRVAGRASGAGIEPRPGLIVRAAGSVLADANANASELVLAGSDVLVALLCWAAAAVAPMTSVVVLARAVVGALASPPRPSNWEFAIGASTVVV